ncbi:MAG: PKD domain-containing protein [Ferruginibacter sp.]
MIIKIRSVAIIFLFILVGFSSCKKDKYSFGEIKTPTGLALTAVVAGVDAANPDGNGTGSVTITTKSTDAISYNIDFGDGKTQVVPSGIIAYKYTNPGTSEYTITVNAIGTGGATSTISKKIKVYVAFEIPADIIAALTNGATRVWVTDKEAGGHVGVGQPDLFFPNYYSAGPNSRDACLYDDEISFSKDANNNIFMDIDNKGQSFSIGAATAFYGQGGGDGCYAITSSGPKKLSFMNSTSGSTAATSTMIQFVVPGNGIINFGTGGNTYEILHISATNIELRNIGIDGLAWYQKLKVKP